MAEEDSSNGQSAISKDKFLEMKNALDKDGDGSVDKVTLSPLCCDRLTCNFWLRCLRPPPATPGGSASLRAALLRAQFSAESREIFSQPWSERRRA